MYPPWDNTPRVLVLAIEGWLILGSAVSRWVTKYANRRIKERANKNTTFQLNAIPVPVINSSFAFVRSAAIIPKFPIDTSGIA